MLKFFFYFFFEKNKLKEAEEAYLFVLDEGKINAAQTNAVRYNLGLINYWNKKYAIDQNIYQKPKLKEVIYNDFNRYMVNFFECCRTPEEFHEFMIDLKAQDENLFYKFLLEDQPFF